VFSSKAWKLGFLLATLFATIQLAEAATVSCPGTLAPTDREFTLTTTTASVCLAYGPGNVNGNNDVVNKLGYVTLDKSDDTTSGVLPGSVTVTPPTSGLSGTFSILAPGFSSLVIAFKSGEGQLDPDWAAFLLPEGVLSGFWTISGRQALSHVNLYGLQTAVVPAPAAVVPAPAALPLFASGLSVTYWLARRRRQAQPA